MMATTAMQGQARRSLIDRLPTMRGRYTANAALAPFAWFRVGGPAEVLFRPADREDLAAFLAEAPTDIPVTVIGATSNLLIRDRGVAGVVIRLAGAFAGIEFAAGTVRFGAALPDMAAASAAQARGRCGLEFLSGIPGTIGGGLRMNAGAYQSVFGDVLIEAEAVDRGGQLHRVPVEDMGMGYRHSAVPPDWIFLSARFRAPSGDPATGASRIAEIRAARVASQPIRARTGGSTFANPHGMAAWELIDRAGCRGLSIGGATVSEQHCNFLVNNGTATAADLECLGETVRRRVFETSGVDLRWEIQRIGLPGRKDDQG